MAKTVIIDGIEYEPKKQPAIKVGDWVQDSNGDSGVVALIDPDGDGWHVVENADGWNPACRPASWNLDPSKRYLWVSEDIVLHRPAAPSPTPTLKYKVGQYVRFDYGGLKSEGRIFVLDGDGDKIHLVEVTGSNRQDAWEPNSCDIEYYGCERGKRYWYVSEESITAAQDTPFAPPAPAPAVGQVWKRKEGILSEYRYVLVRHNNSYFLFNTSTGGRWDDGMPTAVDVFEGCLSEWEYVGEAADLIAKGLGK